VTSSWSFVFNCYYLYSKSSVYFLLLEIFLKQHITSHAAVMNSSHQSSHIAHYYSPVSRDTKVRPELYFTPSKCQKRCVRCLEFGARNNYKIFLLVLFILCNATTNFDGNQNESPLITHKSIAQVLYTSALEHVFQKALRKWLRWSRGSVLPLSTQDRRFKPGRSRQDFSGSKNPQHAFLQKGSKAVGPTSLIRGM
jgi:hypothetical protein